MTYPQRINEVVDAAHENAVSKGFYDDIDMLTGYFEKHEMPAQSAIAKRDFVLAQLALVGSEVSEAVDAIRRKGIQHSDVEEELADVIIRVCDLAGYLDFNLGRAVQQKMKFNESRPRKHGKLC